MEEEKQKITDEILFNRQVNYIVIEKLWEYMKKGHKKQELYDWLGIKSKEYSHIRNADASYLVNLQRKWNKKDSKLQRLGLSKEIMIGERQIEIDGITEADWEKYLDYEAEGINKSFNDMEEKLQKAFGQLRAIRKDGRDIARLFYFFTYGRAATLDILDEEMVDLKESLNSVSVSKMQACDEKLRAEVCRLLQQKSSELETIINYNKLTK